MRILRYFLVGGVSAAADIAIFSCGVYLLHVPYLLCGVAGFTVATAINYFLSVRFVFASGARFGKLAELALVFFVSAIGLSFNQLTLFLMIGKLGVEAILAKFTATAVVFFWNYFVRAYFVFLPAERPPGN